MKKAVINEDVDSMERRIDIELGVSEEEVKSFEDKYGEFISSVIEYVSEPDRSVNSLDIYNKVKETFEGNNLELFISQITCQCIISIVESMSRPPSLGEMLSDMFSEESCGPDCDCDCDDQSTDHVAVKGDA